MSDEVKKTKKTFPGGPGPGRPKGVPNKVSGVAKDAIARVFDEIGGIEHMADWAREHPTQFYNIYSKLIPVQVDGAGENGEHLIKSFTVKFVAPTK